MVKTPPPQPTHTLPVPSSHTSLVCGYHTVKCSCVTQVHVSRSMSPPARRCTAHRLLQGQQYVLSQQLYTQFWGASPFSAVILKGNIPKGMACSLPVPCPAPQAASGCLVPPEARWWQSDSGQPTNVLMLILQSSVIPKAPRPQRKYLMPQ